MGLPDARRRRQPAVEEVACVLVREEIDAAVAICVEPDHVDELKIWQIELCLPGHIVEVSVRALAVKLFGVGAGTFPRSWQLMNRSSRPSRSKSTQRTWRPEQSFFSIPNSRARSTNWPRACETSSSSPT